MYIYCLQFSKYYGCRFVEIQSDNTHALCYLLTTLEVDRGKTSHMRTPTKIKLNIINRIGCEKQPAKIDSVFSILGNIFNVTANM